MLTKDFTYSISILPEDARFDNQLDHEEGEAYRVIFGVSKAGSADRTGTLLAESVAEAVKQGATAKRAFLLHITPEEKGLY